MRPIEARKTSLKGLREMVERVVMPDITLIAIDALRPSPRNARLHSKKQIDQIKNSMVRLGKWTHPLLVDEMHILIAGHARLIAAKELKQKVVPVIVMHGLTGPEKRALALADNKIPANDGWPLGFWRLSSASSQFCFPKLT